MDYNWKDKQITPNLTLAGTYPLEFKIATAAQAAKVASVIKTKFLKPGGLVTTFQPIGPTMG